MAPGQYCANAIRWAWGSEDFVANLFGQVINSPDCKKVLCGNPIWLKSSPLLGKSLKQSTQPVIGTALEFEHERAGQVAVNSSCFLLPRESISIEVSEVANCEILVRPFLRTRQIGY
jgi:hypothetical protein